MSDNCEKLDTNDDDILLIYEKWKKFSDNLTIQDLVEYIQYLGYNMSVTEVPY